MKCNIKLKISPLTFACLFFSLLLAIAACKPGTRNDEQETKTINANDISLGPPRHDTLSSQQLKKIKKIHETFAEVNPASLEETITNFKRDLNPDNEISVWLSMAAAYEKFILLKGQNVDLKIKEEAFKLILMRSMMPEEEAKAKSDLKILSHKDVQIILNYYNQAPKPITVEK
ncbi:MAG TPA: hypothetical protein VK489_08120 [Ferruginibacter sp.]|nr:hypothetical protein [Ferruginibacter sp.]